MPITVAARPAVRPFVLPQPPKNTTLADAKKLIAHASLTGDNDRNLLNAVRMLRNEVQWDVENKALWVAGASAFDKLHALERAAGRAPGADWVPPPEEQRAFANAQQLAARGDKLGAARILRDLVRENCEHEPYWRAGLALFR